MRTLESYSITSITTVLFLIFPIIGNSQGVCPIESFKLKSISGAVFENAANSRPISDTRVELIDIDRDEKVVAVALTDSKGAFSFSNVAKGRYRLSVSFLVDGKVIAPKFNLLVDVTKSRFAGHTKRIEVFLGADCFVSRIRLRKT